MDQDDSKDEADAKHRKKMEQYMPLIPPVKD